jgi:hypothetical protein
LFGLLLEETFGNIEDEASKEDVKLQWSNVKNLWVKGKFLKIFIVFYSMCEGFEGWSLMNGNQVVVTMFLILLCRISRKNFNWKLLRFWFHLQKKTDSYLHRVLVSDNLIAPHNFFRSHLDNPFLSRSAVWKTNAWQI